MNAKRITGEARHLSNVIAEIQAIAPDLHDSLEKTRISAMYAAPEMIDCWWGVAANILNSHAIDHPKREQISAIFGGNHPTAPEGAPGEGEAPAPLGSTEVKKYCHCGSEMGRGVCADGASVICKEMPPEHCPEDATPSAPSNNTEEDAELLEWLDAFKASCEYRNDTGFVWNVTNDEGIDVGGDTLRSAIRAARQQTQSNK